MKLRILEHSSPKSYHRGLLVPILLVCVFLSLCTAALAQFPEKTIHVIVHTSAGGGNDVLARLVFKHASRLSGADFVVENYPGAGGQIGYTKNAMSKPDGYTLGAISTMSIVTHELTRKNIPYKFKTSFSPVAQFVLDPSVVVVRADSPYKNLDDLIADAKANPDKVSWGGTFLYGAHHVHYILFQRATGAKVKYVPFDGGAKTRAALLGGHIDLGVGGISEFESIIKSGDARILVSAGKDKWKTLPDAPTYKELGYDIVIGSNRGFALPADCPEEIFTWYNDLLKKVVHDPEFIKEADAIAIGPSLSYMDGKEFLAYLSNLQNTMAEILPKKALK